MVRLKTITTSLFALMASATPIETTTTNNKAAASLPLPYRVVAQFSSATWIENLAFRSNGDLLLTILTPSPQLCVVTNPSAAAASGSGNDSTVVPTEVHNFTDVGASGLVGITEVSHDLFVVAGFGLSTNGSVVAPVWTVDFRSCSSGTTTTTTTTAAQPKVQLVIPSIPNAGVLNGIASPPDADNIALIADSTMGLLWRVDISTGKTDVAIQVPEMSNGSPGNLAVQGINGVRIAGDGYLYWSNSVLTTIYRVKIDAATGSIAHGATVETVSKIPDVSFVDDIAVGEDVIFAATNTNNTLVATKPFANETVVVLGNQDTLTVAGDTAAIWGRGENDKKTLYVSTSGAIKAPVNGTLYEPGKVVAVDTTGFRL